MLSVKKSKLLKCDDGQLYYYHKEQTGGGIVQPQHLYILSNEEIKDGDVWIENQKYCSNRVPITHLVKDRFNQKIIATTDKSIICNCQEDVDVETNTRFHQAGCHRELQLPQISSQFIKYFIEKNGDVDYVEVEYDCDHSQMPNKVIDVLKLTDNNEVIIHLPKKKIYSRKEVEKLIHASHIHFIGHKLKGKDVPENLVNKWIEENL